jgi:hypothetical protein
VTGGIAVVNKSKHVSPDDARALVAAVDRQVREQFAPTWSRLPCPPILFDDESHIPWGMARLSFSDLWDATNFDAYHAEAGGTAIGVVSVAKILEMGGSVRGAVARAFSHEVLEAHVDPYCNAWIDDARSGISWAFEVCDPVQDDHYTHEDGGVWLSNFVTPRFFDWQSTGLAGYDHLDTLGAPFSYELGGYAETRTKSGEVQMLGERPPWKVSLRAARRAAW